MLSEKDLRDIFPHYKENKYKGIDTSIGVHILSRGMSRAYVMDIDLQEAMRETQRKYKIIKEWSDGIFTFIKYEVLK